MAPVIRCDRFNIRNLPARIRRVTMKRAMYAERDPENTTTRKERNKRG